ncbi:MAG: hypothetical protein Kilf2KO_36050 [Rhodospirillales bacterium]
MTTPKPEPFFLGWSKKLPKGLRRFVPTLAVVLVLLFGGAGFLIGATQNDPGDGSFRWDWGRQTLTGVLTNAPYPVLHVQESERFPTGTALLLSAAGKRGVQDRSGPLEGQVVEVSGIALTRGDLLMLQIRGGPDGMKPTGTGEGEAPAPESLGTWRLTGEICDGKCYAGAMRPGEGLAHKACANLCLIGGVPPVFVSTGPVEGQSFFLLAGPDGGPITEAILNNTATLVQIDGEVERRGELLVFKIAPESLEVL